MGAIKVRVGDKYGMLNVLWRGENSSNGATWVCRCDCGLIHRVGSFRLTDLLTHSCGCALSTRSNNFQHGHCCSSDGLETKTYSTWRAIILRCTNKNNKSYKKYGAVGIGICDEWRDFPNFLRDMGERPPNTTIDRYPDQDGNYEPGNCRWATSQQQARNRKSGRYLELNGERLLLCEWAERLSINSNTISERLKKGWAVERALGPIDPTKSNRRKNKVNAGPMVAARMLEE